MASIRPAMARIGSAVKSGLDRAADGITAGVGTMYCALAFTALACVSLPNVIGSGDPVQIVGWICQTWLQLMLLSVILVGQNRQSAVLEAVIRETHDTVMTSHDVILEELQILKSERQET